MSATHTFNVTGAKPRLAALSQALRVPVTQFGVMRVVRVTVPHTSKIRDGARIMPDGTVAAFDTTWPSVAAFVAAVRREKRAGST